MRALRRPAIPRERAIDVALALLVAATVLVVADIAIEPASDDPGFVVWGLASALGVIHLARRRHPLGVLAASATLLVLYHLAGFAPVGLVWPLLVAHASAAAAGKLGPAALIALALAASSVVWRVAVEDENATIVLVGEVQGVIVVALALAVGEAAWQRGRWAAEVRQRLDRAEAEARREHRRQLAEQRLALASDLHDVTGHSLVAIGLQLRIADEALDDDPHAAREAIRAALEAHDRALRETTATVRVLREGEPPEVGGDGFAAGDWQAMAAAVGIALTVDMPAMDHLPAPVTSALRRICQEALTNTIRHARRATRAAICLRPEQGGVRLRICDDGDPVSMPLPRGFGLRGMEERARSLGGTFAAGPRAEGGFLVDVWLPVGEGT